ncbi:MAG: 4-hydroxy-tetrahydrodipicolinate reductase [Coxiellaceae bacterium]|nr:4-hydroxy-tetrahydrodipicolinate reductase [Coxiellaceae bacterium]
MTIKIIINGANGKMGKTAVDAIAHEKALTLVAITSRNDDLSSAIKKHHADVVIDFTTPEAVFENTKTIINAGASAVIGTTGLTLDQIETLKTLCFEKKRGAIIAPNFSIGAILTMKFAREAAAYFPDVEIIEYHHPKKLDAPSGTAKKTAELIAETKKTKNSCVDMQNESRGFLHHSVPIHAVRLSGLFAEEEVIFGGHGETVTLSHRASDRGAMMPGLFLCCRKVMTLDHLIYGMENFIF